MWILSEDRWVDQPPWNLGQQCKALRTLVFDKGSSAKRLRAPSSFLLLVVRPGAPSSDALAPSRIRFFFGSRDVVHQSLQMSLWQQACGLHGRLVQMPRCCPTCSVPLAEKQSHIGQRMVR